MPFKTRYVFVVSMDVEPEKEALFNEVYDTEHVPELLKVPGVLAVSRSRKQSASLAIGGGKRVIGEGEPGYIAFYEIESPDIPSSDAWSKASETGRWAEEVRPYTHNRHHAIHEITVSAP
ncbi:MAG: hypothetical protein QF554_10335 [Dehalococcoidia bacterium]|jgi:hypothetical protein|nr:hypothetical protein [Dehalococcoidia bacterium]